MKFVRRIANIHDKLDNLVVDIIEKLRNEQEEVEEALNEVQNASDYLSSFAE